ncbi:heterokaryon incompatibility protein-domain-containing protein [Podospora aff. communis PSN243]|uniref:Heterokaryon incompatibility protein-domain-containing protein n=1 Tax=Podospora aff. communis PSN243 TaxID=3040156 RepID=A0AAV9GS85_9PEZI|nr:heterokaryon incompatibility protein-domain-containing protein [Podospora aff. communis PSN243]
MAELKDSDLCPDCIELFESAAFIHMSMSEKHAEVRMQGREASWKRGWDADHQSRFKVNVSASKCHMCVLMAKAWPDLSRPTRPSRTLSLRVIGHLTSLLVHLLVEIAEPPRIGVIGDPLWLRQVEKLAPTTWSPETLSRIKAWMTTCTTTHGLCNTSQTEPPLPRRLLDTRATHLDNAPLDEGSKSDNFDLLSLKELPGVRIVDSNSLPLDTQYLTLSHRWGNPPSILLKNTTSFLLDRDISAHLLHAEEATVFRHAIHVTRALGFRYLWIDALCIMQDGGPEKMADIMQMHEIYSNSMLNIMAAEAQTAPGQSVRLQAYHDEWSIEPELPLLKRGWVFQERALAPRIVHFTQDQAYWECRCLAASESVPDGPPKHSSVEPGSGLRFKSVQFSSALPTDELRSQWYGMLSLSSDKQLTFAQDRPLAISALAKMYSIAAGLEPSEYLAGMWKGDLPLSLLWFQATNRPVPGPVAQAEFDDEASSPDEVAGMEHAPSWSWASISAEVDFINYGRGPHEGSTITAKVLGVDITRISSNLFDGAHRCQLHICGPVCSVSLGIKDGVHCLWITENTVFQAPVTYEPHYPDGRVMYSYWDTSRRVAASLSMPFRVDFRRWGRAIISF